MQLYRGLTPLYYTEPRSEEWHDDVDKRVEFAVEFGKKNRYVSSCLTLELMPTVIHRV